MKRKQKRICKCVCSILFAFCLLFTTVLSALIPIMQIYADEIKPHNDEVQAVKMAEKSYPMVTDIKNGNVVALYYEGDTSVLTETSNGSKLSGITAEVKDNMLTLPDTAVTLTVSIDENGYYTFQSNGKYLTSKESGNGISFEEVESDYSLWILEQVDGSGNFFIKSVNASYNGNKNQYMEYYKGFTTFGKNTSSNAQLYTFQFYLIDEGGDTSKQCDYVMATPQEGEVILGSELTLTSNTQGAQIYYSINGGAENIYNEANKPKFETLPVTITAYAVKEGMENSIVKTFSYEQAQVAAIKATPNGGNVSLNSEVEISCETDGAIIKYCIDDSENWIDYDGKIVVSTLPITYKVKAVKEGYLDSPIQTLVFTQRSNDKYNTYFGQLHSHTSYSDGAGTCEEAYKYASNVKNLDFLAVTDHSNSFDNADTASINDGSMSEEWTEGHQLAKQYTTDKFVGIFGFEMTWSNGLGHINTFNSDGFQSRTQSMYSTYSTALQNYYATLKTAPNSISQFNHPGTTFGDFSDFAYYDEDIDKLITTIEVGNGEGTIGSSGYFPSYEYYQRALDKGWHVAPTNNQDNHKGLWGDANTARSVVLADTLTQADIYDAMRNYRVYATEDNDLSIYYTLNDYVMGSILDNEQTGENVTLKVELNDPTDASIGNVQVITNGGLVIAEQNVTTSQDTVTFNIKNDYSFYYIKVVETDGDIAVTAPVWVGKVEAAGINSISTQEVLPVKGESLSIDLELYNNEISDLNITDISFEANGNVIHKADLQQSELITVSSMSTATYSFDYTYDGVGNLEINAIVTGTLDGIQKVYKSVLKLNYVTPEMVTKVIVDGTHYNDYVTGYYGANLGNFTTIAGNKNVKVEIVKDEITQEMLDNCSLLVISAPAKKNGTANAGDYTVSHFSDDFIELVKNYTNNGGTLITCGIADYQDTTGGQTATQMNKLLEAIGATTRINSDETYDEVNNGGQPYRLYLKETYNKNSRYLAGANEEQEYSAYSGCSVALDENAVALGKAEALVRGYDTTYSIDCKDEAGNRVNGSPVYVEKGNVVELAHETLDSGANIFVAGTVFISDFEVKAELDNIWDLPYLNRTIAENILDEVTVALPITDIVEVRQNGNKGDVYRIEGYVTAGTDVDENKFFDTIYIQDDTAGIDIFPYAQAGLELGTKVQIVGYVDEYQGDKELKIISSNILNDEPKKIINPTKMNAKDAMDYEKSGGSLVQVEGTVTEVLYDTAKTGVSQFKIKDENGDIANIFIDGYILSAKTGKNELASVVQKGEKVSAIGIVYNHPEGNSDEPVTCLRVRNCDEIVALKSEEPTEEPTEKPTEKPTEEPIEEPIEKPTEKPTEEPIEKPIEKPTTSQPETEKTTNSQPTQEPIIEKVTQTQPETEITQPDLPILDNVNTKNTDNKNKSGVNDVEVNEEIENNSNINNNTQNTSEDVSKSAVDTADRASIEVMMLLIMGSVMIIIAVVPKKVKHK